VRSESQDFGVFGSDRLDDGHARDTPEESSEGTRVVFYLLLGNALVEVNQAVAVQGRYGRRLGVVGSVVVNSIVPVPAVLLNSVDAVMTQGKFGLRKLLFEPTFHGQHGDSPKGVKVNTTGVSAG